MAFLRQLLEPISNTSNDDVAHFLHFTYTVYIGDIFDL